MPGSDRSLDRFLNPLRIFRWFAFGESRVYVELMIRDLRQDAREMKKERRSDAFVRFVTFWHSGICVCEVALDGSRRLLNKLPLVGAILRRLS